MISPERRIALIPHVREGEVGPSEVAALATGLDPAQLDEAVMAIPRDLLPRYLYELDAATTLVNKAKKAIATRMVTEQMLNTEWTSPNGVAYKFEQSGQTKWVNVGDLFALLERLGISARDLGSAVSEARVTDLRVFAEALPEEDDRRSDALAAIDAHRQWHAGSPALRPIDDPYRRPKKRVTAPSVSGGNPRGGTEASE